MKTKSNSYLLAAHSIFHPGEVKLFNSFNRENSSLLWQSLFLNGVQVLSGNSVPVILILSESDRDYIPETVKTHAGKIVFTDVYDKDSLFKLLNEKFFTETGNNILFLFNSIGYTQQDIQKTINLLGINDSALVLARSSNDKLCFTGFNHYDGFLNTDYTDYSKVLANSCLAENYIYTLNNYLLIDEVNDFRRLYFELSKKESLAYCSHELHEQFTHLFIEYKELLK